MAGFFDSLVGPESEAVESMKEPGESTEEMVRRKMPVTSYIDDTIGNIPQGIINTGQGVYEAATHPRETAQKLYHYATNPSETASNIYQHYANRYGSIPTALETLRSDPVGVVGDVMPFTSLPGAARSVAKAAPMAEVQSALRSAMRREGRPEPAMRYPADRDFGPSTMEGEIIPPERPQLTYRSPEGPQTIEGSVSEGPTPGGPGAPPEYGPNYRDPMLSIMRTDRTSTGPSLRTRIPELRLNTETPPVSPVVRAASEAAEGLVSPHIPSIEDFKPKSRETLLRLREQQKAPSAFEANYLNAPGRAGRGFSPEEIIFGQGEGMNPNVYNALLRTRLSGKPLTPFEQNMVNNYMASFKPSPTMGIHGRNAVGEISPPKIRDTTIPPSKFEQNWRNAQKQALDKWRAENPRGLERDPRYIPYLEEELPVVYKDKPLATREAGLPSIYGEGRGAPPSGKIGEEGEVGGRNGILKTALGLAAAAQDRRRALPDLDIYNRPKKATQAPTKESGPVVSEGAEPSSKQTKGASSPGKKAGMARPSAHPATHPSRKAKAPAKRERGSDRRYWGDWRDTEPFASDPIRGFFEEMTGQKKMAKKPGSLPRRASVMDLGDLLPFAQGGMVREGYEDGGSEDRIPILSDIGDAVGGMFDGLGQQQAEPAGSEPVVAQDRSNQSSFFPQYKDPSDFFQKWSENPLSQFLFATGIGAMASDRVNPLQALGEGGIRGLEYMRAAQAAQAERRAADRTAEERARQQRLIEQTLGSSDESAPGIASDDSSEAAPISTAASETPETATIAPEGTEPAEAPEGTEPAEAPEGIAPEDGAPSASEVSDKGRSPDSGTRAASPTDSLYSLHRKISSVMSSVTDPQLRLALANRQKAVEFEINRIEKQREQAAAAQKAAEDRAIRVQQQKRLEQQSTPEYKTKIRKAEALGKRLDETEASLNSSAQAAPSLIDQFEVYKKAIADGTVITGAYGEDRSEAHKTILGLTGENSDLRSRLSDNIKAGALQQAFAELGGRLGAGISDADRRAIQQMGISLDRDQQSNVDAIETFQNAQRRKIAAAEFMEDYKTNKSSVPGQLDAGFEAAFTKWVNSQPSIVPDRMKSLLSSDEKGSSESKGKSENAAVKSLMEKYPQYTEQQLREMYENQKKGKQ